MVDRSTRPLVACTQCGARLDVPEGEVFLVCAHCASALFLDRSQVAFHYAVTRTLSAQVAERTLRRWMAGNETAKDLDREAEIDGPVLRYVPLWRFRVREHGGQSTVTAPAMATTLGLLDGLSIPPGELRFYDPKLAPYVVRPTVPHTEVAGGRKAQEVALVHVPLYFFQYRYKGQAYQVAVDGATGRVFAETYPRRRDLPYQTTAAIAFAIFTLVALTAYLFIPPGSEEGWIYGARCGVQLLAAVPLFFLARQVARDV